MGPGARPVQPGENPGSILKELQDIRASYTMNVDSDGLKLAYNFRGQDRRYDLPFVSIPVSDGARWLLYGGSGRAKVTCLFTLDMIRGAENMAGRPLTQTEAEGFALHTGKRMRYNFMGTVVGFGVGYGIAARTWKTMKFPFVKAKPIESYNYFPARRLAILSGSYARLMWQITRANIYAGISLIFAQTLLGSMGDSVMAVGLYRDTRTQEVVKAMKGNFDRIRMNRSQPGQGPPQRQQPAGHDQDPQNSDFYGNDGGTMQNFQGKSTDYSGDQTFSDSASDTGVLDDSAMKRQERRREARRPEYNLPPQTASGSGRKSGSDFFFDDASPTVGNDPDMGASGPYRSSGSTWDKIRKGGRPQPQDMPQPQQQEGTAQPARQTNEWRRQPGQNFENKGDSFSFSRSDEERQLARSQAQKEFDAMLERERKEGGSEGYMNSSFAAESGAENPQQAGGSAWGRRRGS